MKKNLWKIFTILWASIIIYFSFFNTHQSESSRIFEHQDKAGHVIFYAILTYGLIKVYRQEIILQQPSVIASIVSFIFGIVIELFQHYITTDRVGINYGCLGQRLWNHAYFTTSKEVSKIILN